MNQSLTAAVTISSLGRRPSSSPMLPSLNGVRGIGCQSSLTHHIALVLEPGSFRNRAPTVLPSVLPHHSHGPVTHFHGPVSTFRFLIDSYEYRRVIGRIFVIRQSPANRPKHLPAQDPSANPAARFSAKSLSTPVAPSSLPSIFLKERVG